MKMRWWRRQESRSHERRGGKTRVTRLGHVGFVFEENRQAAIGNR